MAADSIFDRILLNQTWAGDQPVFISPGQTATWGEMTDLVRSLDLDELGLVRHRVGIVFRPVPACIAALALLDRLECDTFLMDGLLGRDDAIRLGTELKLSTVLIGSDAPNSRTIEPVILACELPGSGRGLGHHPYNVGHHRQAQGRTAYLVEPELTGAGCRPSDRPALVANLPPSPLRRDPGGAAEPGKRRNPGRA